MNLITDLALILLIAGVTTLLFKFLKQPLVLGYVVAGLLVGPSTSLFPTIGDPETVKLWGEIGVIFLLFTIGLEFSFKKLLKVGGTGAVTTAFEFVVMFSVGYLIAKKLGWSHMNGLFLGAMLTISSTTIIAKAFNDMNLKSHYFAGIVIGVLVVEDLIAIIELVVLPTIVISQNFSGSELIFNITKLVFFLILWFVTGIYLIPTFIKAVHRYLSDETLLIVSLGLCLGMVVLANYVGFSSALGAFLMGSILAESIEVKRIERLIKPIKDLFVAVFFVSVGLLVNPLVIIEYWFPIVVITIAVIIVKPISATIGVFVTGQPLKAAMQSGFCLCQIGEFSFIIATLGLSMNLVDSFLYPIIVAVSVITTFITPYEMKAAIPLYNGLMCIMPTKWRYSIETYTVGYKSVENDSDWKFVTRKFISSYIIKVVIILGLIVVSFVYIEPAMLSIIEDSQVRNMVSFVLTMFATTPFILALVFNLKRSDAFVRLWNDSKFNRGYISSLIFVRVVTAIILLAVIIFHYMRFNLASLIIILLSVVSIIIFSRHILKRYRRMELRFLSNMKLDQESKSRFSELFQRDIHFAQFNVSPDSKHLGIPLGKLKLRENYGVNIVSILRGGTLVNIPKSNDMIFPNDVITVLGTDVQLRNFRPIVEKETIDVNNVETIELQKFSISKYSQFVNKSIRESRIRETYDIIIAGIERSTGSIMNPESYIVFEPNDTVWFVGEVSSIRRMCNDLGNCQIEH